VQNLRRRRLGDRILRRQSHGETAQFQIEPQKPRRAPPSPALLLIYGFLVLILVGTILLSLPIASSSAQFTSLVTALFTATSAVCVTGLVVVNTGEHWSYFGQAVILVLMQLGGLGFMTGATVLFVLAGRRITLQERILLRTSVGSGSLGGIDKLALRIVGLALVLEGVGILIVFPRMLTYFDPLNAFWQSLFLTVSAFNNAGFDITTTGTSLVPYHQDPVILLSVCVLVFLGAISYVVMRDIATIRRFRRFTLDTKLVVVTTLIFIVIGTLVILLSEFTNVDGMGGEGIGDRLAGSLFLSLASRTAGFTIVDIGAMQDYTLFFLMVLMLVGGASGSTAGGIKLNTFAVLGSSIIAVLRGRDKTEVFGREIPDDQVRRALTIGALAIIWIHITIIFLAVWEDFTLTEVFFEAVSAFSTNGLSMGITGELSFVSKLFLIVTMFVGRLGPMTIVFALVQKYNPARYRRAQERVRIG
jgi:trk system potassium uptake protein TrkH